MKIFTPQPRFMHLCHRIVSRTIYALLLLCFVLSYWNFNVCFTVLMSFHQNCQARTEPNVHGRDFTWQNSSKSTCTLKHTLINVRREFRRRRMCRGYRQSSRAVWMGKILLHEFLVNFLCDSLARDISAKCSFWWNDVIRIFYTSVDNKADLHVHVREIVFVVAKSYTLQSRDQVSLRTWTTWAGLDKVIINLSTC